MIKHFCDMCGIQIPDDRYSMRIQNEKPFAQICVELCGECHAKVTTQLFPELCQLIEKSEKRLNASREKRAMTKAEKKAATVQSEVEQ